MQLRSLKTALLVVGLGLGAAGVALFTTAPRRNVEHPGSGAAVTEAAAVPVTAYRLQRSTERERIEVSGLVQPIRRARLAAEVDGQVVRIDVREHERGASGAEILKIDDSIRRAAVERAAASLLRAESAHRLAELEAERLRRLRRTAVASQAELDAAEARVREATGARAEARATLAEAEVLLERTSIRAPFAGILTAFDIEVGDHVMPGTPIGEWIDLDQVEIELGLNESQVVAVQAGDPVAVRAQVYPGRTFPAAVRRIGAAIDRETRLFPVAIEVDNRDGSLLAGMVVVATLEIGADRPVVHVPREATVEEFGLTYVYVITDEDDATVARRRRVTVGAVAFRPTLLAVFEGVDAGERIVAEGLRNLRDGMLVVVEDHL